MEGSAVVGTQASRGSPRPRRSPGRVRRWSGPSNWALKLTMACTGLIWVLFALIHLFGNLKVFAGPESFDAYAHWLRQVGYPLLPHESVLWTLRVVLVVALVLHVTAGTTLWVRGRRRGAQAVRAGLWRKALRGQAGLRAVSAALMPVTGLLLLAFLVLHIMDLTTGTPPVASTAFEAGSPFHNLVASFSRPWMAAIYAAMMLMLSIHVLHGVQVAGSDLGAVTRGWRFFFLWVAGLAAIALLLGNGAIPILVQTGVLR